MAKRFRFNLEAVLRYRAIQEDEAKREYLELKRLVEQERLRREELAVQRGEMQDEIVQAFAERAPMQAVTTAYSMIGRIESAMAESHRKQAQLEAQAEQKRQIMIVASQKKKVMETLKENRRIEYIQELDRVEQAFLDEMSIQAQGRRLRDAKAAREWEEMESERQALLTTDGEQPQPEE